MQTSPETVTPPCADMPIALPARGGEAIWFLDALTIVKQSAAEGAAFGLLEYQMAAQSQTPLHRHLDEEEAIYVLDGELTVFVGDQILEVGRDAYLRLPARVAHGLLARTDVRMLVFTNPDGFVSLVRAMGSPAPALSLPPSAPPDLARLLPLAERYGLERLGPLPTSLA